MIATGIALWIVGWCTALVLSMFKDHNMAVVGETWWLTVGVGGIGAFALGTILVIVGALRWLWMVAP